VGGSHSTASCLSFACHGNAGAGGGTLDPNANAHGGSNAAFVNVTGSAYNGSDVTTGDSGTTWCYNCHNIAGTGVSNESSKIEKYAKKASGGGVALFYHPLHYVGTYNNAGDSNYNDTTMFTDAWSASSLVTCDDCHEFTASAAGPHAGSSQASMLLKGIDTTTTMEGTSLNGSGSGPGTDAGVQKNLCVNCHNAAAYTFGVSDDMNGTLNNYEEIFSSTDDWIPVAPTRSRIGHYGTGGWSDGNCGSAGAGSTSGIGCKDCHGGQEWRGGLHGLAQNPVSTVGSETYSGTMNRLMGGDAWEGVETGSCYLADGTNDSYTNCGNSGSGHKSFGTVHWGSWP
jgi:hypothetical protein